MPDPETMPDETRDAFDAALDEYNGARDNLVRYGRTTDAVWYDAARAELRRLYDAARQELEVERMRLAAVGVAALGGDVSDCLPEYRNAAVEDVVTLRAKYDAARQDADRLDWLEQHSTLHENVEFLYVVDGYEVMMERSDGRPNTNHHGETIRAALDAAREARDAE